MCLELISQYTYTKFGWFNTPANDNTDIAQAHQFKYHNSWEWLMPVLIKIENLDIQGYFIETITMSKSFSIAVRNSSTGEQLWWCLKSDSNEKFNNIYSGVLAFIDYYNENLADK